MDRSPTGRLLYQPESLIDRWLRRNNPARAADAYQQVRDMDLSKLEARIHGVDPHPRTDNSYWALDFATGRVLAMPRALGAPYGATALRQWAKRERIHARLRIARKRH